MQAIVKYVPKPETDAFILAMFLLWASRPSKQSSEPDGSYFMGDVGEAREKNWERLTPYSPARGRSEPRCEGRRLHWQIQDKPRAGGGDSTGGSEGRTGSPGSRSCSVCSALGTRTHQGREGSLAVLLTLKEFHER
jgi:hypothetical protein